jgi:thiopeptide-type bacteriocin biosynthesis protein
MTNSKPAKTQNKQPDFPFEFISGVILRTPVFPFCKNITAATITEAAGNKAFTEAVYLASPSLYHELVKLKNNEIKDEKEKEKVIASAAKYYQRMSSRCTPFGLFAATSLVKWDDVNTNINFQEDSFSRYTRLDMHFLGALMQKLNNEEIIKNRLKFFPNNSLFRLGNDYRFTEYIYENGRRIYRTSSVDASEYLQQLVDVCKTGLTMEQMAGLLANDEISLEEALEFVNEAVNAQVFVSEMNPAVAGMDMMQQLLATLSRINADQHPVISGYISQLATISEKLKQLDEQKINHVASYHKITELLSATGVVFEDGKIFQTDSFRYPVQATVSKEIQQQLKQVLLFNGQLSSRQANESLTEFAKKFTGRFEQQEIPLLYALDTETGIGYAGYRNIDVLPLVEGITPWRQGNQTADIQLNRVQAILFEKLLAAHQSKAYEMKLADEDIPENKSSFAEWPPSMSIIFRLIKEGDYNIFLESAGNPSANNLAGRFAHGHPGIHALVNTVTAEEEKNNEDVIFAEIVHLPENRIGNILLRPSFRRYEIPFVSISSCPQEDQIPLDDIVITVRNGKVYLYSKKLQKRILPRLSSAHNYSSNALPIYHFLCDIQTQELKTYFGYSWGSLSGYFEFLPRVTYRQVILSPATWQFKKEKIDLLLGYIQKNEATNLAVFFQHHQMPRYFVLADSDNELLVDTESILSLQAFVSVIKKRVQIVLKEHFLPAGDIVLNNGKILAGQLMASLTKSIPTYKTEQHEKSTVNSTTTQRIFIPGSEWLYLKLYCGSKTADQILAHNIQPIVHKLLQEQAITKWFFIRYNDPDFHIRLRMHLSSTESYNRVMQQLLQHFSESVEQKLVSKIMTDTYTRELERYGNNTIDIAENLFWIDSEMKLQFLFATEGDEREELRWLWGMKNVNWLLDCFSYSLGQKEQFMKGLKEAYSAEFNMNKYLGQQVNKKYNQYRGKIEALFTTGGSELLPLEMFAYYEMRTRDLHMQLAALKNPDGIDGLMSSYIHMLLNRLFISEPRLQEMVLYDFLYKAYVWLGKRKSQPG